MLEYYIIHGLVAAAISLSVAALNGYALAGAMFYVGREHAQWEMLGHWDWPGLLVPVLGCLMVQLLIWRTRGVCAPWLRLGSRPTRAAKREM